MSKPSLATLSEYRWAIAAVALVGTLALKSTLNKRKRNPRGLPPPPGPKGLPLLDNLLQIPQENAWKVYNEWRKEYGDIIYLEALGQPIMILNSLEDCVALFDKRATNYSDRAEIPAVDMMSLTWSFALMSYGASWRSHRRAFHQFLNHTQVPQYRPVLEQETRMFLQRLLQDPKEFMEDIRYLFGSIIMRISYGVSDFNYNKSLIIDGENLIEGFAELVVPGRLLVNNFPALRHVPDWFPGTGWKRELARLRQLSKRKDGSDKEEYPSIAKGLLDKIRTSNLSPAEALEQETIGRNTAALSYIAGADTSVSSAQALFFALVTHPHVQARAQAELESVIGKDRLPKPEDVERLPYIQAIVKETGRWHVIVPFAIPHLSREDDEYKGYFIPAGTVVMPNSWAILHDPETFPDPFTFKPERYLTPDGELDTSMLDPEVAAFGYGRRICPGRHLSNESLALMAASVLSVFDLAPPKNEKGEPMEIKLETLADSLVA
ncbi:cytochrome P450 [Coprinopsis cinerea okayama7|uniref:Cytochrome P450 n=1 Tax=Coprinopsis cinerea (strain Okayama-7 / 130 / ATCC MYA-4618 / FGSC 9003) TaxID=240176 RepID=A8NDS9_COPC7|nr:cytochrome P450 [Coprinopsis cinerea okayama7\|eukprot:XP_001832850.2 cytochrome P450 [Coprinopsis cinerea okayama7\